MKSAPKARSSATYGSACLKTGGPFCAGPRDKISTLFGIYIRAPDLWKLLYLQLVEASEDSG